MSEVIENAEEKIVRNIRFLFLRNINSGWNFRLNYDLISRSCLLRRVPATQFFKKNHQKLDLIFSSTEENWSIQLKDCVSVLFVFTWMIFSLRIKFNFISPITKGAKLYSATLHIVVTVLENWSEIISKHDSLTTSFISDVTQRMFLHNCHCY